MDLLEKIELFLGESKSDGKSFPARKKKDDKSSEEQAQSAEKKLTDMEINAKDNDDGEDPYDPETDLDKEKKQKELKKKALNTAYVPPYHSD